MYVIDKKKLKKPAVGVQLSFSINFRAYNEMLSIITVFTLELQKCILFFCLKNCIILFLKYINAII